MDYRLLGYLNVLIVGLLILPFILNRISRYLSAEAKASMKDVTKFLRKLHKPLGIVFLATGLIHGYLALGGISLHTGTLLYAAVIVQAGLGGAFYRTKKKGLFKAHRMMAFVIAGLLLLHYVAPGALYQLIR